MRVRQLCLVFVFVVSLWCIGLLGMRPESASAAAWLSKVDHWVLDTAVTESNTEFLVFLDAQADVSGAYSLPTKEEKGQYVFEQLTAVAEATQPPVIAQLKTLGVDYRSYWGVNMIWVKGGLTAVQAMAERDDVKHIYANPAVAINMLDIQSPTEVELVNAALSVGWNINKVGAPDVWADGFTGQGIVIGGQDTGYRWDHDGLINQYRGWNGTTADHNYNWHDAIHFGGGSCGADSSEPCDDQGHGTHTMGTMVGDDGGSNQVGMAPGAKWIGCRNMNIGTGSPTSYTECYQWFIAPTDLDGNNPDPSKAPHVINNSWSCPPDEGCSADTLLPIVQNVRAAGIVTVHSAGNDGSACSTIENPGTIYDESFSVAATFSNDHLAEFSSRGPVTVDGSNRLKPDITAPGVSIRSTTRNGDYQGGWQGTSMAAPHVAGQVALLLSAAPYLAGDVDKIEEIIQNTAVPLTTSDGCGGDSDTDVPNHSFGWGRIDVPSSFTAVHIFNLDKVTADYILPNELITYTIQLTHTHGSLATNNVIVTDTIPAGTTFVTATMPHTFDGQTVSWQLGTMAAEESWQGEMVVRDTTGVDGKIVNHDYGVRSDDVPIILGQPVTTTVVPYGMAVYKTASGAVSSGALLTYTLTVSNGHPFAVLTAVSLTDTLPANTTFVTATMPHAFDGSKIVWQTVTLPADSEWTVDLIVQANLSDGIVSNDNYWAVADELPDGVAGAPVVTEIADYALRVEKTAVPITASPNDLITYTLTVLNYHAKTAVHNLVLTDTIPMNTEFVSATVSHSQNNGVVEWQIAELVAGQSWQVNLVVQVAEDILKETVVNEDFGVLSDEVGFVMGTAVTTTIILPTDIYLPFVATPAE